MNLMIGESETISSLAQNCHSHYWCIAMVYYHLTIAIICTYSKYYCETTKAVEKSIIGYHI